MTYHLKKYKDFYLILFILLLTNLIHRVLGYNEMTLLPFAKHFYNPSWIANDFALSSPASYQLLFNYFAGWLCSFLPMHIVSIVGRLIVFTIFSFSLFKIGEIFKLKSSIFLLVIIIFIGNQSVVSGEWMIKGFEFKTISYACVFLALYYFLKNESKWSAIFWGLAISFHVLIGLFSFIAFILTYALSLKEYSFNFKKLILPAFLTLLFGMVGWFSIFNFLFIENKEVSSYASMYYVQFRVAHHVNPSFWEFQSILLFLVYCVVIFISYKFIVKDENVSFIYKFFAFNLLFVFIGLFFYFTNNIENLKYYWFRTSDSLCAFLFFFSLGIILEKLIEFILNKGFIKNRYWVSRLLYLSLIAVICVATFQFYNDAKKIYTGEKLNFIDDRFPYLNDVFYWINENTLKTDGIITSPLDDFFFVFAERRNFANYKTGPAEFSKLEEWYHRLVMLNNNVTIDINKPYYSQWEALEKNYNAINEESWNAISNKYNFQYLLCKSWVKKDLPIAYQNEAFILYKLKNN